LHGDGSKAWHVDGLPHVLQLIMSRKRGVEAISFTRNVSCAALDKIQNKKNNKTKNELADYCDITTPYGNLISIVSLPLEDETADPYQWPIVNPFAFLYVMCLKSVRFAAFLKKCVGGGVAGIVLYTDETTPGNQLRPDSRGDIQCFYWTFSNFPDWYRSRRFGWFAFGFLTVTKQHEVKGDISRICKHMLSTFFNPEGFNFEVGMHLPHGREKFHLVATLKCFLQDGKAFKELNSTKGGGGWHNCQECKNVVNVEPEKIKGHPYLRHFAFCKPAEFDRHTSATFFEMADKLASAHLKLSKEQFGDLQLAYGINYEPDGLIFDRAMRHIYSPMTHNLADAQHVLVASGGVAQHEVAAFVDHAVRHEHLSLHSLDEWVQAKIHFGRTCSKLCSTFFQDRVTLSSNTELAHFKGYASECISAVQALVMFFEAVYEKAGIMLKHGKCLREMMYMLDIVLSGDQALQHLDSLKSVTQEHNEDFIEIYDIHYAKSKFHTSYHIPEKMEILQFTGNCFATERMHKMAKSFAHHASGKTRVLHMTRRYLLDCLDNCSTMSFSECELHQPAHPTPTLYGALLPFMPQLVATSIQGSKVLTCTIGTVTQGDLLAVVDKAGLVQIGVAVLFAAARNELASSCQFFVCLQPYSQVAPGMYAASSKEIILRPVSGLQKISAYSDRGNGVVQPLLPWQLRGRV